MDNPLQRWLILPLGSRSSSF